MTMATLPLTTLQRNDGLVTTALRSDGGACYDVHAVAAPCKIVIIVACNDGVRALLLLQLAMMALQHYYC
jgi:hypothetical protein